MYARRYDVPQDEKATETLQIPPNYDGNAFSPLPPPDTCEASDAQEEAECTEEITEDRKKAASLPSFKADFFNGDLLLLLLAFLLSGAEEADDLPSILIFLMLL